MSKKPDLKAFLLAAAIILLLVFFNFKGWLDAPKEMIYGAGSPLFKVFDKTGGFFSSASDFFLTIKELEKENRQLRQENEKMVQEVSCLKEIARENEVLRQRLFLPSSQDYSLVMANVVGYNPQLGQVILVDKGEADGLSVDLAAVTASNFLIGRVAETGEHWAKIILISDSSSEINALTQDTRVEGIVRGSHGLGLFMEMIPIDKKISAGEDVLTSGLNNSIPKGFVIGKVKETVVKESEIFQKARLQPSADLQNLDAVFIVLR